MRVVPTLVLLTLLISGCAYQNAMKRAESMAEQGQWRSAVAEYEAALAKKPKSEKARAGLDTAIEPAVRESAADAKGKLANRDYEGVMKEVWYIEKWMPGEPVAVELRAGVDQGIKSLFDGHWANGEIEPAYSQAARARDLLGGTSWTEEALSRSRTYYFDWADGLTKEAKYSDAIGVLAVVRKYEPAWNGEVDARESRIRGLWADERVAIARKFAKKKQKGASAAAFGGAVEVAQRGQDIEEMRGLVADLRNDGWFWLYADFRGEDWRTARIRDQFVGQVQGNTGLAWANTTDQADVHLRLTASPAVCENRTDVSYAQQQYIAGYRDVPNPDYQRLVDSVAYGERQVADHAGRWERARSEADAAYQNREWYRSNHIAPLESQAYEIRSRLDSARGRWESTKRLIAEYEAQRPADTSSQAYLAWEITMGGLKQQEIQDGNAVYLLEQELGPVQAQLSANAAEYSRLEQAYSSAQSTLSSVEQSLRWSQESLERDRYALAGTPASLQQPIYDVFNYEVYNVTRTCSLEVRSTYRWPDGNAPELSHGQWAATSDISWNDYPQYGVIGDPLAFPMSDGDLIATADANATNDAIASFGATIQQVYQNREADALALASRSRFEALDQLLPLYLVVPNRISQDTIQLTANISFEAGGLYNLATLNQ